MTPASRFVSRTIIASIQSHRLLPTICFLSAGWACLAPAVHAQTATFNMASVLNIGSPGGNPLNTPANVAVDSEGDAYIADVGNNRVVERMANGTINVLNVGTPGGSALNLPLGVAVDKSGDVYISDSNNERVVEYTAGGTANVLNIGARAGRP